jgi:hypothetical protein
MPSKTSLAKVIAYARCRISELSLPRMIHFRRVLRLRHDMAMPAAMKMSTIETVSTYSACRVDHESRKPGFGKPTVGTHAWNGRVQILVHVASAVARRVVSLRCLCKLCELSYSLPQRLDRRGEMRRRFPFFKFSPALIALRHWPQQLPAPSRSRRISARPPNIRYPRVQISHDQEPGTKWTYGRLGVIFPING